MKTLKIVIFLQFCYLILPAQSTINKRDTLNTYTPVPVSIENLKLADKHVKKASKKQYKGDLEGAVFEYQQAIMCNPNNANFYNNIAVIYLKDQNFESALKYFELALKIIPDDPSFIKNTAVLYYKLGDKKLAEKDYPGAIVNFNKALSIKANYIEVLNDLAVAYYRLQNYVQLLFFMI
jgi:Flp pilus assembly protein TadD